MVAKLNHRNAESPGSARAARVARLLCAAVAFSLPVFAADLAHLRNGFSIRHEHRQIVGDNTRLFLTADNSSYIDVPSADITGIEKEPTLPPVTPASSVAPPAVDLNQVVRSASAVSRLDPELVNSLISVESGFNTRAVSRKGAQGLMQLMPETASHLGVTNPFDPQANVDAGTRYLRQLLEQYHFDLVKALAAYNAGPQRVDQYGGVPPYRETRAYVARIVHDYNQKIAAENRASAGKTPAPKKTSAAPAARTAVPRD